MGVLRTFLQTLIWQLRWNGPIHQNAQLQLNWYVIDKLSGQIIIKEIDFVIQKHSKKESSGLRGFTGKFCQMFKEKLT